ncbi:MAG: hypothetical protein WD069_08895 [Planctomycetales bacterium]
MAVNRPHRESIRAANCFARARTDPADARITPPAGPSGLRRDIRT